MWTIIFHLLFNIYEFLHDTHQDFSYTILCWFFHIYTYFFVSVLLSLPFLYIMKKMDHYLNKIMYKTICFHVIWIILITSFKDDLYLYNLIKFIQSINFSFLFKLKHARDIIKKKTILISCYNWKATKSTYF